MTPAEARIRRLIGVEGAITVARYMTEVLLGPGSYYRRGEPLGGAGDYVTAPEVSQMFGELVGLWCVATWQQMGRPAALRLVELGPGRGTLMADALRAAGIAPGFPEAAHIHLVETSATLRDHQRARLAGRRAAWHEDFASVPEGPAIVIANEFFDALPIRQFVRTASGWRERVVVVDAGTDRLAWRLGEPTPASLSTMLPADAPEGAVREVSAPAIGLMHAVARRIAEQGGAALVIDYGYDAWHGGGETLQAVRAHRFHDPLDAPGTADLSAHVDFGALAEAAREAGARPWPPRTQGDFLCALGIEHRAAALRRDASPADGAAVDAALRRLIHPDEMGTLFRVLAVTSTDLPAPAGFEDQA